MTHPSLNAEASAVLQRARELARQRDVDRADGVDILGALVDGETGATQLLELFKVQPAQILTGTSFVPHGAGPLGNDETELRTVDLARAESARLGQEETGTEHLLLALLRQPGTVAAVILNSQDVTLDPAREAVRFIHGQVPDWQPPNELASSMALSWGPMEAVTDASARELAESMHEAAMSRVEVGLSRLDRVIAIGHAVEASGVVVEMTALELRQAGAILLWRAQTADERLLGPGDLSIVDDVGTHYDHSLGSWSGSGRESRGETWLVPRPPDQASALTIEVRSFSHEGWMPIAHPMLQDRESVSGPWHFEVLLGERLGGD